MKKSDLIKIERKTLTKEESGIKSRYCSDNNLLDIEINQKENVNDKNINNNYFQFNSENVTLERARANNKQKEFNKKKGDHRGCFDFDNLKEYYEFEKFNTNRINYNFKEIEFYKKEVEKIHTAKNLCFKRFNSFKSPDFFSRDFYLTKASEKKTLLCKIKIQNLGKLYPVYHLYDNTTDKFLISVKKVKFSSSSEYIFSTEENDFNKKSKNYIGKMCSNFIGNKFEIFDYLKENKDALNSPKIIENKEKDNKNSKIGIIEYVLIIYFFLTLLIF